MFRSASIRRSCHTGALALGLAATLAVIASVSTAQAQTTPPTASQLFSVPAGPAGDAPIQWLQNIFLGVTPGTAPISPAATETFLDSGTACGASSCQDSNISGAVQTGLRAVLSWYSYAMLVLGSFLLFYYLMRIIAETAHTGRPGGRANQLWGPIRTVLAIGLLVPLSTGLNSGQMIVINVASEGSALASNVWALFLADFLKSGSFLVPPKISAAGPNLATSLFLSYVCENAYNSQIGDATTIPGWPYHSTDQILARSDNAVPYNTASPIPEKIGFGLGGTQTAGSLTELCGSLSYETPPTTATPDAALVAAAINAQQTALIAVNNSAFSTACQLVQYLEATGGMSGVGWTLCPQNAAATEPTNANIQSIINGYQAAVNGALAAEYATAESTLNADLANANAQLGWLSAGSLFLMMGRIQSLTMPDQYTPVAHPPNEQTIAAGESIRGRIANNFGASEIQSTLNDPLVGASFASYHIAPSFAGGNPTANTATATALEKALNIAIDGSTAAGTAGAAPLPTTASTPGSGTLPGAVLSAAGGGGAESNAESPLSSFIGTMVKKILGLTPTGILAGQLLAGFPITALQRVGYDLMEGGAALYVTGGISGIFSSAVGSIAVLFGTALFAPGVALAYLLPVLPFIRFLFAVFGWLLQFAEAVVSVPVFALAHLDPEGEGVLPQQVRSGYLMLLQLLFRPVLIVAGLILALLLMDGMYDFLNMIWSATVLGAAGEVVLSGTTTASTASMGGDIGPFAHIVYGVIYAALVYSICNACFKMIDYVPNQMLRWIGGGGDQHDSSVYHGHATAAVAGVAGASQQLGQAVGNMGMQMRQRRLMKAQQAAVEAQAAGGQNASQISSSGIQGQTAGGGAGEAAAPPTTSFPNIKDPTQYIT